MGAGGTRPGVTGTTKFSTRSTRLEADEENHVYFTERVVVFNCYMLRLTCTNAGLRLGPSVSLY